MRVLVVEDSKIDRVKLAHTFERHPQINAVYVDSLAEAKAQAKAFDILLLDLNLPDAGPTENIEFIQHCPIPVVVFSGSDDDDFVKRTAEYGALNFVTKSSPSKQLWITMIFTLAEWGRNEVARDKRRQQISKLVDLLKMIRSEPVEEPHDD